MTRSGEAQPVAAARAARSRPRPRSRTVRIQVVDYSHRQAATRQGSSLVAAHSRGAPASVLRRSLRSRPVRRACPPIVFVVKEE